LRLLLVLSVAVLCLGFVESPQARDVDGNDLLVDTMEDVHVYGEIRAEDGAELGVSAAYLHWENEEDRLAHEAELRASLDPQSLIAVNEAEELNRRGGGRRSYTMWTHCAVVRVSPGARCPVRVEGIATASSATSACAQANFIARNRAPRGCQAKHCVPCRPR